MNENIEKVLAALDGFRMNDEMTYSAYSVLHDEISLLDDLLKAQEPVQLGELIEGFDNVLEFYSCGFCGNAVRKPWVYCPNCGRMIKWND